MLNGQTALVVEEEFLIALDIQRMLEGLGVGQTLFARTAAEAEELRAHWPQLAVAIVEISRDTPTTLQLIDSLDAAGVPSVLTTAHSMVPSVFTQRPELPLLVKPVPEAMMASAVEQALATRSE